MAKKKARSSPVRHPLTPEIMTEIGGLTAAPPPAGDFRPDGNWTAWYRIWTCYGHRNRSNVTAGALGITRRPGAGGAQRLTVRQVLRNSQGKLHTLRAEADCRGDALGSPTSWTLTSEFGGAHMADLPEMKSTAAGRIRDGVWETSAGGSPRKTKLPSPATGDWCLFEAVQRMPFRAGGSLTFAVLEGLSVLKADHRLWYRGRQDVTWGPERLRLHRFDQVGRGVYPYEYWLDEAHRLLLVTTGPRSYILDPAAAKLAGAGGTKR